MKISTKVSILIAFFSVFNNQLYAQKKLWDIPIIKKFTTSTKDSTRSPSLLILPVLGYSQETKVELGATGIYNFYVDKADTTIYTSNINTVLSLTTEKQINLKLETDIWTKNNDYHYIAAVRYKKYPFNYYGIGGETLASDKTLLTQRFLQFNFELEKKIVKKYYTGVNIQFENFTYTEKSAQGNSELSQVYGGNGGKYLALGLSQSYDSRNSNTETTKGLYGRVKYAYVPNFWGEDNYTGGILSVDLRAFFPLHKNLTLGVQSVYKTLFSDNIPFYLTPQLGNDEIMRGYYQGRYRDKNYLANQAELRYRIHPRIGFAAFLGAGTVYEKALDLSHLKFSGGGGFRYFFDLEHNSSIRIDYAIGEKNQGEERQGGFYLSLGQAF
jgi:hypothetical protein